MTAAQIKRLTNELPELYRLTTIADFPARALEVVGRVIGCDTATYNEIDPRTWRYRVLVDPPELVQTQSLDAFRAYVHEHPVISHYAATGDASARLISDFLSPVQLRRLGLYSEFLAPLGIDDQLSTTMTTGSAGVVGVALNRGGQPFVESERALLNLLRPHLVIAHDNAVRFSAAISPRATKHEQHALAEARHASTLERLTARQRTVLELVSQGHTNDQIAHELGLSSGTVKKHLEHILKRLDVRTRVAAATRYLAATAPVPEEPWAATLESR